MKKIYLTIAIFITNIVLSQTTVKPVFEYFNTGQVFSAITVDKNNNVWAGTDRAGAFFLNQSQTNPSFSQLSVGVQNFELSKLRIQSMASDGLGNVWVAHAGSTGTFNGGGVERVDINSLTAQHFTPDRNAKGLPFLERDGTATLNAQQIAVSKDNTVWIAQRYHDLTVTGMDPIIDPLTGQVTTFPGAYIVTPGTFSFRKSGQEKFTSISTWADRNFNDPLPYPAYTYNTPISKTAGTRTFNAITADSSAVWASVYPYLAAADIKDTEGQYYPSRILKCDLNGSIIQAFTKTDAKFRALGGVFSGVYANDSKGVWATSSLIDEGFSVYYKGNWVNLTSVNFPNIIPAGTRFNTRAIWGNQYGNVFMGTNKGLIVYDGRGLVDKESSYTLYNVERHGLISNNILAGASETITDDSPEELDYKLTQWIATDSGIIKANIGAVPTDDEFKTDVRPSATARLTMIKNENAKRVEAEMDRRKAIPGGDNTYHKYTILTEICDMSIKSNDPKKPCTQEAVYRFMQENAEFQAPTAITMSQNSLIPSIISKFSEQDLKDINNTINEQTDNILTHEEIYNKSSASVKQVVSNFINYELGKGKDVVEGAPGIISQFVYDKNQLYNRQKSENEKECKNDIEYKLYNSPAFIYGRLMTFKNPVLNRSCSPDFRDKEYDPVTMFVYDKGFTIINYTSPGHALYPGKVSRAIVTVGNKVYVGTIGEGYHFCNDSYLGRISRKINLIEGSIIFKNIDINFKREFTK
jgi:hypothetical protein